MKKYACHRLYQRIDRYDGQSFIALDEEGIVMESGPLTEEIAGTEWIGGVIVLSSKTHVPQDTRAMEAFHHLLSGDAPKTYAWHISVFDFQQGSPIPGCIIRRL